MAELVTIAGQTFKKRNPLGVLGLTFITFGIYFFVWYFKINDEVRRYEHDETVSPTRSLMAMIFGWLIIVPPFIAMYNTARHVQAMEQRAGVQQTVEPSLTIIFMLVLSIANGIYVQEHLNRVWDRARGTPAMPVTPPMPPPPPGR
ncbi:MAG TPA: DUF4234 domain-containing protein [Actinomycetota bacterium]|nr:DUF4234 domain-containing protein [Actinomycetota bacterium]